jgi:hypothetical protein
MKLTAYFRDFMSNTVNLEQKHLDELGTHVNAIYTALKGNSDLGDRVLECLPQGSWAHRTIIEPLPGDEFDADILLRLEYDESWEWKDYISEVRAALKRHYRYKDMLGVRKDRCVRVVYAGDCHVDVVPYVEHPLYGSVIVNQTLNTWEASNPDGFTAWMLERDQAANRQMRKVVRLLKYLRDYKNTFSVPSVILTTLVGERISVWFAEPHKYKDLPTALVNLVEDLDAWLQANPTKPSIADPSCTSTNFDHRWDDAKYANFRNKVGMYAGKIRAAYDEPDKETSLALWQDIFGDEFQKAPVETAAAARTAPATVTETGDDPEQFIRDLFPVAPRYGFDIKCRVRCNGVDEGWLRLSQCRVRKGRDLTFTVSNCDVPGPYRVFWKVRNSGGEAAARPGGLRGQIHEGSAGAPWTESTSYYGGHYVEAYIVRGGVVVASAHHPVIVVP